MNLISFSLWGSDPKYTIGAVRNAELAKIVYPDWKCRFYVGKDVPLTIVDQLENLGSEILIKYEPTNWTSMFWRFEAGYDKKFEKVIFRDTDSRLNLREKAAVEEWEKSEEVFHVMRDHPCHGFSILGGMWGVKTDNKYNLQGLLESFHKTDQYGTDYIFFSTVLFPLIMDNTLEHDEFFRGKPFPSPRVGLEFVGEVFDEFDVPNAEHRKILQQSI